jgi:hypothetical protein
MTSHGAYTQLLSKANACQDFSKRAAKNIKTLMAAGPLPEDEKLVAEMLEIRDRLRAMEQQLYNAMHDTLELSERYLGANRDRIRKPYEHRLVVVSYLEQVRMDTKKQEIGGQTP